MTFCYNSTPGIRATFQTNGPRTADVDRQIYGQTDIVVERVSLIFTEALRYSVKSEFETQCTLK